MKDREVGSRQDAVGSGQTANASRRLVLLGVVFLGAALLCDVAWLTRSPSEQGGMAFGVRRLGLRVELSQARFEAVATGMAAAGLACVAIAFVAARRPAVGSRQSPLGAIRWLAAVLLFVAVSLPWHRVVGWASEGLRPEAALDAAWERRYLFRELALAAAPCLFWLAALLALGAWLLRLPRCAPRDAMAGAVERLRAAPRGPLVAAAALVLAVLAVAFILGIHGGKPCFPDASVYYCQAKAFASGRLSSPVVGERGFFDASSSGIGVSSFAFVGGRWFGVGLPGAPMLFAVGLLLGLPWLVPPLLGGAVVVATWLLAKEVFGDEAGLLALPLAALSPWLVFLSGEYLTHVPCMLATTLFLAAALRCLRLGSHLHLAHSGHVRNEDVTPRAAAAGLLLGASALMRPVTAAALALPVGVAWLVWLVRRPAAAWRPTLALAVALAIPLTGLLLYNQATTGHPFTFGYQVVLREAATGGSAASAAGGWRWTPTLGLSNLLATLYLGSVATFQWPIPLFGVLLASLVFLGLGDVPERRRGVLIVVLSALSLALAHVRWSNVASWMGGPRYFAEATPLVAVAAAGVLVLLARRLTSAGEHPARATGVLGLMVVFLFLHAGFRVAAGPDWRVERAESQARRSTLAAIRAQVKPPAIVFLPLGEGHSGVADFYAALAENDPALGTHSGRNVSPQGILFARDLGAKNRVLADARPRRRLYRWDAEAGKAVPLSLPAPADDPAARPE